MVADLVSDVMPWTAMQESAQVWDGDSCGAVAQIADGRGELPMHRLAPRRTLLNKRAESIDTRQP